MFISISIVVFTFTFIIRNPVSLTINFGIAGVLLMNSIEETVPLNLNTPFVYNLIRNNVIKDLRVSRHLFNNLKWF